MHLNVLVRLNVVSSHKGVGQFLGQPCMSNRSLFKGEIDDGRLLIATQFGLNHGRFEFRIHLLHDHWLAIGADGVYASLGPSQVGISGSILTTDVGYNIEISMERSMLGAGSNTLLGFNLAINDDDNQGSTAVDAYGLWTMPTAPSCATCCNGFSDNYPWCDTTRLGQLQLVP